MAAKPPAPTRWIALSTSFPTARRIDLLTQDFGPLAMAAFVALLCDAGQRQWNGETPRGVAKGTYRQLAMVTGEDDHSRLQEALERMAELSLIELDANDDGYRATFPEWDEWDQMAKDPNAAVRQARKREKDADAGEAAEDGPGF